MKIVFYEGRIPIFYRKINLLFTNSKLLGGYNMFAEESSRNINFPIYALTF